jgi:hypothetical protein
MSFSQNIVLSLWEPLDAARGTPNTGKSQLLTYSRARYSCLWYARHLGDGPGAQSKDFDVYLVCCAKRVQQTRPIGDVHSLRQSHPCLRGDCEAPRSGVW